MRFCRSPPCRIEQSIYFLSSTVQQVLYFNSDYLYSSSRQTGYEIHTETDHLMSKHADSGFPLQYSPFFGPTTWTKDFVFFSNMSIDQKVVIMLAETAVLKGTVQWELRWVKIGINRNAMKSVSVSEICTRSSIQGHNSSASHSSDPLNRGSNNSNSNWRVCDSYSSSEEDKGHL
jgi:hypothetical protein